MSMSREEQAEKARKIEDAIEEIDGVRKVSVMDFGERWMDAYISYEEEEVEEDE